jgi:hypothetical protein
VIGGSHDLLKGCFCWYSHQWWWVRALILHVTALIRGRMLDTEMEGSNLDSKETEVGNHWGIVN